MTKKILESKMKNGRAAEEFVAEFVKSEEE